MSSLTFFIFYYEFPSRRQNIIFPFYVIQKVRQLKVQYIRLLLMHCISQTNARLQKNNRKKDVIVHARTLNQINFIKFIFNQI